MTNTQKIIDDYWNVLMKCDWAKLCATFYLCIYCPVGHRRVLREGRFVFGV